MCGINKIIYTPDFNAGTTFYTDEQGETKIENLKSGEYKFIETINPNDGYELNIGMEEKFNLTENDTKIIENIESPTGSLIISKVGIKTDGSQIPLNGVKFKLRHSELGYVKQEGDKISYVKKDSNQATEFETGIEADGKTKQIDNLKTGYYTVIENYIKTSQEGEQYSDNDEFKSNQGKTTIIEVKSTSSSELPSEEIIENPGNDDKGNLRIIKEGNNGKRLSSVAFKVENNIYGYVYYNNGKIDYTQDINRAQVFATSESGLINIENLKVGDYTLYEIYNPNKPYVEYPDLKFKNVIVKSKETTQWNEFSAKNYSIRGNLKLMKEDEITKKPLKDVVFILENKKEGYVQLIDEDVTYTNNRNYAQKFTTNESGIIEIEGLEVGEYFAHEIENRNDGYERYPTDLKFDATVNEPNDTVKWSEETYENTPRRGKLEIEKKVENTNVVMSGIGFIIEHKEKGYVSSDGIEAEYTDDRNKAEIFYTGDNGKTAIEGLLPGDYNIYEVENDYYGFVINPDEVIKVINLPSGDDFLNVPIENKQEYIKLRGYVWEDHIAGKGSVPNDYYDGEGSQDNKKSGIGVYLKEGDKVIDSSVTDGNGAYEFKDVDVDKLGNYYIEFEYDGFVYTNVIPHIDADNGSKVAEPQSERSKLNEKFNTIERGDNPDRQYGVAKDASGNPTLDLKYNYGDHKATIDEINKAGEAINPILGGGSNPVLITANTNETSYSIQNEYNKKLQTQIVEYIDNINLGIYQREQPDIALVKDIQSIKIIANKKIHVYEYANRFDSQTSDNSGRFGVEYGSKFKEDVYERPVYKEDYNCAVRDNNPTQFEVYITYKIALRNESTSLVTQVNSIVDYYDARYEIKALGNKYTSEGAQVENVNNAIGGNSPGENAGNGYNKTVINLNDMKIQPQTNSCVYVQFELTKDAIKGALSADGTTDLYKNIAEINSYSTYDKDGKIYAGIDEDSAPGNIILGDTNTYEDDVDIAPAMRLKIQEQRTMQGKVFLDQTTGELRTGEIREGNGEYKAEDNDKPIQGVGILLKEKSGSGNTYSDTTNGDGEFYIEDYIAGDYELTYTWGGQKVDNVDITLQNYKATVYKNRERQNTTKWHLQTDRRYSDAFDDMATREYIDSQLKTLTNNSGNGYNADKNTKMNSTTPEMNIEVEYDTLISTGNTKHTYAVQNVDFGIVRRAKQSVKLEKRVSEMTITLANGQVVSKVTIDKKGGTLGGNETKHITYMGPLNANSPGFVKAELDNELLQGSKIEVTYELKFKNISEVDVMNNDYYKYGSDGMSTIGNTSLILNGSNTGKKVESSEVVTITPVEIVDYLDRTWGYEANKNQESGKEWTAKTKNEFEKQYIKDESGNIVGLINADVINNRDSEINNRIILVTKQWQNEKVLPGGDSIAKLNVSKTLTTTDEISLGNETETVKLEKPGGSEILENDKPGSIIPGSYIPGQSVGELDTDEAETVIVTPSTGANLAFVIPITIAVIALVILGIGIVLIKKKAIDSNK